MKKKSKVQPFDFTRGRLSKLKTFQNGFTLVELLVYMGVLTILVSILSSLFKSIADVELSSKATSSVDQDSRFIISRLIHDMQTATAIVTPNSAGATSNTLQITVNSVNYTYSSVSGSLKFDNPNYPGETNYLNSIDTILTNLSFTRIGSGDNKDTIQVNFTLKSVSKQNGGAEQRSYQTTLGLE